MMGLDESSKPSSWNAAFPEPLDDGRRQGAELLLEEGKKGSDSQPAASYIHIAVAKVGNGRWRGCIITSHIVLSHDCRDGVFGQGA